MITFKKFFIHYIYYGAIYTAVMVLVGAFLVDTLKDGPIVYKSFAPVIKAPLPPDPAMFSLYREREPALFYSNKAEDNEIIQEADGRIRFGKTPWLLSGITIDPNNRAIYATCSSKEALVWMDAHRDVHPWNGIWNGKPSYANNTMPWTWMWLNFNGTRHALTGICNE